MSRRKWLGALGIAGAAGLAGCSGGKGTPNGTATQSPTEGNALGTASPTSTPAEQLPDVEGTYTTLMSSSPSTLNPLYNTEDGAGDLISYTLEMGYGFMPGNRQMKQLYELTTDKGQVWTAKLRENLHFSDPYGQVTAEDFVYVVKELHQTDWAGTANASYWPKDYNVTQTGKFEFQIELPSRNMLYPESYGPLLYPIPKDLIEPYVKNKDVEGLKQDEELNNLTFTGNLGAYKLDKWEKSARLVFKRNPEYYLREATEISYLFEKAPYFNKLQARIVPEQATRLAALETGETDVAAIPPNQVAKFRGMDSVDVNVVPTPYNKINMYNMRDNGWNAGPGNLFRSKTFRQGLGCAVDKKKLVRGVYRGYANPEYTWQPRWSKWYPKGADMMKFGTGELYGKEATQSRIKKAIDESKYDYSYDGDRLVNPSGEQVELSLYHSAGQSTEKAMSEFIAQEFERNAGIKVRVEAISGAQFDKKYLRTPVPENPDEYEWTTNSVYNAGPRSVTSKNGWDMSTVYGLNTYPLNPTTSEVFFKKKAYFNPMGYYPSWDAKKLFKQAKSATSQDELQKIFEKIFVNIAEDQPMGMEAFGSDLIGYSADIEGPVENFFNGWNFSAWHRTEE